MTTADESLFGVKDFGELTLPEFAELFAGVARNILCGEIKWTPLRLMVFTLQATAVKNPLAPAGVEKIKELFAAIEDSKRKYGVKFEILPNNSITSHVFHILINVFVDDVCVFLWDRWCSYPHLLLLDPIGYLNDAYQKHLHALHHAAFKANVARITEELVADAMHPRRLKRHLDLGGDIEDF